MEIRQQSKIRHLERCPAENSNAVNNSPGKTPTPLRRPKQLKRGGLLEFEVCDDNRRIGRRIVFQLKMKILNLHRRFQIRTLGRDFTDSKKSHRKQPRTRPDTTTFDTLTSWYDLTRAPICARRYMLYIGSLTSGDE